MAKRFSEPETRPAGYAALIERYQLEAIPNWHESLVGTVRRVEQEGQSVREYYPSPYWPGEELGEQLEFALKYDGTNLSILAHLFRKVSPLALADYIRSRPTGKYARRIWYLYELITEERLALADLEQGNYVDLLDPEEHYTCSPARAMRRQRINDNLLGDGRLCPVIRRTEALRQLEALDLKGRCQQVADAYPPELLRRALSYLYTKETKSSFEIEHEHPGQKRTEQFVALLRLAHQEDFCSTPKLLELQRLIVDPRFRDEDLRTYQNYVGETVAPGRERVHYVCPKPEDIGALMEGLSEAHRRMAAGGVHPVVHAATVAYAFVFLHPFEDGNGRIHRFLLHNILALRGFTPPGFIFPISAVMLKDMPAYDASLEAFSKPLLSLLDYTLDAEGRMTVHDATADHYRFIDMTVQAETLFRFIQRTIDTELVAELDFLSSYDQAKRAIQDIVDLPDRRLDLFIRFCLQNNGRLSARKRESHFPQLAPEELAPMEEAVRAAYAHTSLASEG